MKAWCFANGTIGFGAKVPAGAIEMARGAAKLVRQEISVTARLAYDGQTLLVPGVPEAPDQQAAGDALMRHLAWLKHRECKGFSVNTMRAVASAIGIDSVVEMAVASDSGIQINDDLPPCVGQAMRDTTHDIYRRECGQED